jgi:gliding motility-associated-like protein
LITRQFILFLLLLFAFRLDATHIVGGEMYYECLGNNQYRITLKVYRDCYLGQAAFDNPAYITVFNSNGSVYTNISLYDPQIKVLPGTINNPCVTPPNNVCVEEGVYSTVITLPASTGGYTIAYQRCCRNNSIINLNQPGDIGATYSAYVPGNNVSCNSNPQFKNFPPIYVCVGFPLSFDHSATDFEGDSIVYSFCNPFAGASPTDPAPFTASAPPFPNVNWVNPYNSAFQMNSSPILSIDPSTGIITGTPNQLGQWVIGICASEYRNGILISETKRDFQFNVVSCPGLVVASVPGQTVFCTGFNVNFTNNSINATTYFWDFGVPGIGSDTSSLATPSYTYPDTGKYVVTLIANPGSPCADTATTEFIIYPLLEALFSPPDPQCLNGNNFNFAAGGVFGNTATFNWDFGNAAPAFSAVQNPSNVSFLNFGTFPVTLTIYENACTRTHTANITVLANPTAVISDSAMDCRGISLELSHNNINSISCFWDFGVPGISTDTSTLPNPSYTYPDTGFYTITLIADPGSLCPDTAYKIVQVQPLLEAIFSAPNTKCLTDNIYNFSAGGNFSSNAVFNWDFQNANIASSSDKNPVNISFTQIGDHEITLTISDFGCVKSHTEYVQIVSDAIASFVAVDSVCFKDPVYFFNNSENSSSYIWNFNDPANPFDKSSAFSPYFIYSGSGNYEVMLTASNPYCSDTSSKTIYLYPYPQADFIADPPEASIFNPFVSFTDQSVDHIECKYILHDQTVINTCDFSYTFSDTGSYNITLIVTNVYGCTDTISGVVKIYPEYRFYIPNSFTPNGDGMNDTFGPVAMGIKEFKMDIYNRWGERIFESTSPEYEWDGKMNGNMAQQGVYVYVIQLVNVFNKTHVFEGHVSLIR